MKWVEFAQHTHTQTYIYVHAIHTIYMHTKICAYIHSILNNAPNASLVLYTVYNGKIENFTESDTKELRERSRARVKPVAHLGMSLTSRVYVTYVYVSVRF